MLAAAVYDERYVLPSTHTKWPNPPGESYPAGTASRYLLVGAMAGVGGSCFPLNGMYGLPTTQGHLNESPWGVMLLLNPPGESHHAGTSRQVILESSEDIGSGCVQ